MEKNHETRKQKVQREILEICSGFSGMDMSEFISNVLNVASSVSDFVSTLTF